jgi:hypothetical protein
VAAAVVGAGLLVAAAGPAGAVGPSCLDTTLNSTPAGTPRDNGDGTRSVILVNGGPVVVTLPAGISSVSMDVCGALGQASVTSGGTNEGGRGGRMQGRLALDPAAAQSLTLVAGGRDGTPGGGGPGPGAAGAGGGYSGVFLGAPAQATALLIAGGGGGASAGGPGGSGGGTAGAAGTPDGPGGGGGTQTEGGAGGAGVLGGEAGTAGSALTGGSGGFSTNTASGGGGGGGWYGGGGGGAAASVAGGSGGGGSGYVDRARVTDIAVASNAHLGEGTIVLTYTVATPSPSPSPSLSAAPSASPTASPSPSASASASASASPTTSASPSASVSPTASASATPSATPTATTSASPGSCTEPTSVSVLDPVITATGSARGTVQGRPGAVVDLLAYTRPSTSYAVVRTIQLGSDGTGEFLLRPPRNTRLYAQEPGCAASPSRVVNVRTLLTMAVVRNGPQTYTFSGSAVPARPLGLIVSLYRITDTGEQVLSGQARANPTTGEYEIERTFSGTGRFGFVLRTGQDMQNAPGTSNVRSLLVY